MLPKYFVNFPSVGEWKPYQNRPLAEFTEMLLAHGIWSWNGSSTGAVARLPTNFDDEHSTVGVCGAGVCGFAVSAAAGSNGLT